jgi:hypothetical protein
MIGDSINTSVTVTYDNISVILPASAAGRTLTVDVESNPDAFSLPDLHSVIAPVTSLLLSGPDFSDTVYICYPKTLFSDFDNCAAEIVADVSYWQCSNSPITSLNDMHCVILSSSFSNGTTLYFTFIKSSDSG